MAGSLDLYLGASLDGGPDGRKPLKPSSMYGYNGTVWLPLLTAADGSISVTTAATSVAPATSSALESTHVFKASAGTLYGVSCVIGATSGWLMLFDATVVPGDGAVTPLRFWPVFSDGTQGMVDMQFSPAIKCLNGISVAFSTTGPLTKTAATALFSAQVV